MRATLSSFPRITKLEWINKLMGMQVSETKTKFNAHMLSSKVVEKKNTLYVWVNNWITHKKFIISFSHIATEPETTADILAPLQKDRTTPSLACLKNKNKTFKKCKKKKKNTGVENVLETSVVCTLTACILLPRFFDPCHMSRMWSTPLSFCFPLCLSVE